MGVIANLIERLKEKKEKQSEETQKIYGVVLDALKLQEEQIERLESFEKKYLREAHYSIAQIEKIAEKTLNKSSWANEPVKVIPRHIAKNAYKELIAEIANAKV